MTPSLEIFSPLVGNTFIVETQVGLVELVLAEANEQPRKGLPEHFRTPLSLIFSGSSTLILSQDNYYINHPAIGRQAWLIAPITTVARPYLSAIPAPRETVQRYQVVFA